MNTLTVNIENCYGIRELKKDFDFSQKNTFAIYAPNGTMKTSFSKIFQKLQSGKPADKKDIKDHIFERDPVICEIQIDNNDILKEEIFVIRSFESAYASEKMANLLIDKETKEKLEETLLARDNFFGFLVNKSGIKKEILEEKIKEDFNIESFLRDINTFDVKNSDSKFSVINYSQVFDDSIIKTIESNDFQDKIKAFIEKSDEVYSTYTYLKKGEFSLAKLKEVQKGLDGNNFFVQENKILLKGSQKEATISNKEELEIIIGSIEKDLQETKEFKALEKSFGTAKGRVFKDIIEKNPEIIEELKIKNLQEFKKKLWLSYFKENENNFNDLKTKYKNFSEDKKDKSFDETPWKKAYEIFKNRFSVPFEMEISNKVSCILGESLPKVEFKFWDEKNKNWIFHSREKIENDVLSQGEKRALYLLHIIFDIEERIQSNQKTLFIVDDIADSFDYKNKYAIIEYLKDISEVEIKNNEGVKVKPFYSIILTHNFDFFRTIQSRIIGQKNKNTHSLYAQQETNKIVLNPETYIDEPFKIWKKNLTEENIIALIPFVRNLIEYGKNIQKDFILLTHLLHKKNTLAYDTNGKRIKVNSNNDVYTGDETSPQIKRKYDEAEAIGDFICKRTEEIIFGDIKKIYQEYLGISDFDSSVDETASIYKKIISIADKITEPTLENKITLAIAIRFKAEEFLIAKIANENFVNGISQSQTSELITKFKNKIKPSQEIIKILDSVNIITPENIHLNSFMYEPILDMGIEELKNLYEEVKKNCGIYPHQKNTS